MNQRSATRLAHSLVAEIILADLLSRVDDQARMYGLDEADARVGVVERQVIAETLERHHHHRIATARELGISRVTLYNKMKKFGITV